MVHQGLKRRHSLVALAALSACAMPPVAPPGSRVREAAELATTAPQIDREFRAAWVATVANIDWPSRKGLSADAQQAEVRAIVARAVQLGLNALILQVRTSADAFYPSRLEPWSEYLTGTQGTDPGYDPLAYWLEQAHGAGLELHAWFNPYRARQSAAQSSEHASHLANTRPDWVKRYGRQLWIDPGEPGAAAHALAVFREVLSRYPIDGLHIDDYFYPYPEKDEAGNEIDFPDEPSWLAHGLASGLTRADWRRRNVDELVKAIYQLLRELRPQARFGISPFGLMKPAERPPDIQGFSQYDQLYADVERWLAEGWLDYLVPQLYWPRAQTAQAFQPLLETWHKLNTRQRAIWPGLFTSRINDTPASWLPEEISAQIAICRQLSPAHGPGSGHVHFSMVALSEDRKGIAAHLQAQSYSAPALPPQLPWLPDSAPPPLQLSPVQRLGGPERWRLEGAPNARRLLLWWRVGGQWRAQVVGPAKALAWPEDADALVASAISETGIEGPRRAWSTT